MDLPSRGITHWIPAGSLGESRPVYHFPKWLLPLVACPECHRPSLSLTESQRLLNDIQYFLIEAGGDEIGGCDG
jgi:hypothetical protein